MESVTQATDAARGPVERMLAMDQASRQFGIDFIAPAHEGDVLVATARERTRFGRSGIYDLSVQRGDEVIAEFRGRSRSIRSTHLEESPWPGKS